MLAFFIFQTGKVTGSIGAGVIDLTLDDEDYGSSQGNWKDIPDQKYDLVNGIKNKLCCNILISAVIKIKNKHLLIKIILL